MYIPPQKIQEGIEKGLNYSTIYSRYYRDGWDIEDAISKPVQKRSCVKKWKELAARNGIEWKLVNSRKSQGWEWEPACTTPKISFSEAPYRRKKSQKYSKELREKLKLNGIGYQTFLARIKRGWSIEEASTKAPLSPTEIGKLGRQKCVELYGKNHGTIIFGKKYV